MIKILRIEQWSKNLVIFLPAIFANKFLLIIDRKLILVFIGFSLIASSTYIFNDIKDINQDKKHPTKRYRPLANGDISIHNAKTYSLFVCAIGFITVYYANRFALIYCTLYCVLTILYSNFFKYKKYFDFLSITILFGIRLFLGSYLTGIVLTNTLSFFILSTISQIVISKKISIKNNYNLDNDIKVKKYLLNNYKKNELDNIFNLFLILSLIILFFWSIQWFNEGNFKSTISILNFFSLCSFNYMFYKDTYAVKTEDFIHWIKDSKIFFLIIFSGLCVIGLLYL